MNNETAANRPNPQKAREHIIIRTSIIGIIANLFLAVFKTAVGLLSNSIAIVLDAVNNLSDALSSIITIIGTKLAGKKPSKKHPLGYGRIEYLSAMIVAAIVLYAGITAFVESFKKIIHPQTADYSTITLIIVASAVIVKFLLGRYVSRQGKKANSGSLIASGKDASFDAILSFSVFLSAIIYLQWGIRLEAWVGIVISVIIIKSGLKMLEETLDEILGKRIEKEFQDEIKKTICEEDNVFGAYDLILHNYGPDRYIGSVHVEIPDNMTADEIDLLERQITQKIYLKYGIIMGGIGIYSRNTQNDEVKNIRSEITRIVMAHEGVLQIHGFYADTVKKTLNLDIILDFTLKNREKIFSEIRDEIHYAYPEYSLHLTLDLDL